LFYLLFFFKRKGKSKIDFYFIIWFIFRIIIRFKKIVIKICFNFSDKYLKKKRYKEKKRQFGFISNNLKEIKFGPFQIAWKKKWFKA